MSEQVKFERGEPVLVWGRNPEDATVRIFSHSDGDGFYCVNDGNVRQFMAGEKVPLYCWLNAEKLPKPAPFSKGELVVTTQCADGVEYIAFSCGIGTATNRLTDRLESDCHSIRRPTIEELRNWIPWCEIKPKQGENQ